MNNPSSSNAPQDPVPPLSEQAVDVERESTEEAAERAAKPRRIPSVHDARECCNVSACCESVTRFVKDYPCLSVGIAFALGIVAGRCVSIED